MSEAERYSKPGPEAEPAPPIAAVKPARTSSGGRGLLWFCMLLLIAGTGSVGWQLWQQQATLVSLQAAQLSAAGREATLLLRLQEMDALRQSLEDELQRTAQTQEEASATLASELEQSLDTLQQDLLNLRLQSNTEVAMPADVLLAEARALLRLGRERLLADQDVQIALSLYRSADEVLSMINDPSVQPVRQTLRRESDSLRELQQADIAGMHAELGRLKDVVNGLSLANVGDPASRFTAVDNAPRQEAGGWIDALQQWLGRYFVISRQAQPVRPRLSEEGKALIRLDITLQLEQARLALLQTDTRLYQQAVNAAAASIETWAAPEDAAPLLSSLETLRDTPIAPTLPPLGAALDAVRSLEAGAFDSREQR